MRTVRITRGTRYTRDFMAPEELTSDEATVALYDAEAVSGDSVATDLSGRGNHGTLGGVDTSGFPGFDD